MFAKSLLLSILMHSVAMVSFTLSDMEPGDLKRSSNVRLIPMSELRFYADSTDDPSARYDRTLSYINILRKTTAPRLELYHKTLLWEDEPRFLAVATTESSRMLWRFEKESASVTVTSSPYRRSRGEPLLQRAQRIWQKVVEATRAMRGPHEPPGVVSSLRGRRIVSSRSPDYPPGFARSLSPHVVIARIGVDARGNIRQLMLLNSTGVRALDTRALRHIRGWKFTAADDIDEERLEWGLLKVPFVTR